MCMITSLLILLLVFSYTSISFVLNRKHNSNNLYQSFDSGVNRSLLECVPSFNTVFIDLVRHACVDNDWIDQLTLRDRDL